MSKTPLLPNFPQVIPKTSDLVFSKISILCVLQATTNHMDTLQFFKQIDHNLVCTIVLQLGLQPILLLMDQLSPCHTRYKEKQVVEVEEASDSSEEGRRGTHINWTKVDNIQLMSTWLNNSVDPIKGNDKKSEQYWKAVAREFNTKPLKTVAITRGTRFLNQELILHHRTKKYRRKESTKRSALRGRRQQNRGKKEKVLHHLWGTSQAIAKREKATAEKYQMYLKLEEKDTSTLSEAKLKRHEDVLDQFARELAEE
uniref:No apical meristem-associated C-terminal domain-containing protein n=1 Tax=Oryza meridionalis TaxID=40149 RepID=A0A0E0C238_9ORYZ